MDFFPLTVDVEERQYAIGKIPGSFFRREGRPSEDAILTCRLTDRPLRPAFPDGYRNETQIVTNVIGADHQQPYDVLSINAASAALMISGIPFDGPIGAVRLAFSQSGEWIPHPTYDEAAEGTFELVVAGRELDNGDVAVMMVEAGGTERAFEFFEDRRSPRRRGRVGRRPRGLQDLDQRVDRSAAPTRGQRDSHAWCHHSAQLHPGHRLLT
jgi:polyribonucleotide nucleotidyltransferase